MIAELEKLTDEELDVRLAALCGWIRERATRERPVSKGGWKLPNFYGDDCDAWTHRDWPGVYGKPPRYADDLNECAKVEAGLTEEQHKQFRVHLWEITESTLESDDWSRAYVSATARQRTIALIATLEAR